MQTIPAFSSWSSSFPLARAAKKCVGACLAPATSCRSISQSLVPTLQSCAKVLEFGSAMAVQSPREAQLDGQER